MKYRILITDTCLRLIEKIPDKKIQRSILDRIQKLSDEPEKQGKKLVKDLSGRGNRLLCDARCLSKICHASGAGVPLMAAANECKFKLPSFQF